MLAHQHAVAHGDRERPARATLADHAGDARHLQPRHRQHRAGDRAGLAALLGVDARECTRRVDHRDDGKAEAVRELERAHRLLVALRAGHAEVAVLALFEVAALLVADDRDRATTKAADARDHRGVVVAGAIAVQLDPIIDQQAHVVERVWPLLVACELYGIPDVRFGRALGETAAQAAQRVEDRDLAAHACGPPFCSAGPCPRPRSRRNSRPSAPG